MNGLKQVELILEGAIQELWVFKATLPERTPITAMVCRQCLPLSVVQLKGKHCRKPHCRNGVVGTFGP